SRRVSLGKGVPDALRSYDWPGNVRELRNALERAVILSRGGVVELEHLPDEIRSSAGPAPSDALEEGERRHIVRILDASEGNRPKAAERRGISRSTLKRKLAELRLEDDE